MSTNLQQELNLTLQKIGRNVLHFQRMESMLKFLITRSYIEVNIDEFQNNISDNINKSSKKTMGSLVKEYVNKIYLGQQSIDSQKFSLQFIVNADENFIQERKNELEELVEKRNLLIHQMLSDLDQTSLESCKKLSNALDSQENKINIELSIIQEQITGLICAVENIEIKNSQPD